jgi:hypothetical protein
MTDRELLEAAAKAAGLEFARWDEARGAMIYPWESPVTDGHLWNPLQDDGDALRTAAALRIDLEYQDAISTVLAVAPNQRGVACSWSADDDRAAATRRAIVRAAAAMPPAAPTYQKGA